MDEVLCSEKSQMKNESPDLQNKKSPKALLMSEVVKGIPKNGINFKKGSEKEKNTTSVTS